jgi:hypothetical protein
VSKRDADITFEKAACFATLGCPCSFVVCRCRCALSGACQSNRPCRKETCCRVHDTWGSKDKVARAEAPVSPRGSPPRLLDLRRGRGLVIVTGPPWVLDAPLGGLNGGKGSSLLSAIGKLSILQSRATKGRSDRKQKMITAGSRPPSAPAAPTLQTLPSTNLGQLISAFASP